MTDYARISDLTAATSIAAADLMEISQDQGNTTFLSKKITSANLLVGKANATIVPASSGGTTTGNTITITSTETQAVGDAVMMDSNGKAHLAKADAIANAGAILIAASAPTGSASATYLLPGGTVKLASSPSWTVGGIVYLSVTGTTGNTLTQSAPSSTNNVIQPLGVALAADTLLFMPNLSMVEHT